MLRYRVMKTDTDVEITNKQAYLLGLMNNMTTATATCNAVI